MMRHLIYIVFTAAMLSAVPAHGQSGRPSRAASSSSVRPEGSSVRSDSRVRIAGEDFWIHTIVAGDTLYSLADLYGVNVSDIIAANPLVGEGLKVGGVVKIPDYGGGADAVREGADGPKRLIAGDGVAASDVPGSGLGQHVVAAGDTMYSIARRYGISLTELLEDNPDIDPAALSVGTVLMIRRAENGVVDPTRDIQRSAERSQSVPERDATIGNGQGSVDSLPAGAYYRPVVGTPHVALMLPLAGTTAAGNDFVDFYRGALLAMETLKSQGRPLDVTLYDTARSADKVFDEVSSPEFSETDLMIGPIYESEMAPALQFADVYGVPIVSPLASVRELDSEMLWVMSPDQSTKYDKIDSLLRDDKNIILVSSSTGNDKAFETEIVAKLGQVPYKKFTIGGSGDISTLIDWNRKNVFIVLAATELATDRALATISSSYNNASARRARKAELCVLGNSKWASYATIDKNMYFKLGVCFVTSYYVEHSGAAARFEGRYLEAYGDSPSRAAFRGYDAMALFAGTLFEPGESFEDKLVSSVPETEGGADGGFSNLDVGGSHVSDWTVTRSETGAAAKAEAGKNTPLRTTYRFIKTDGRLRHVNGEWTLVCFSPDFSRVVK